MIQLAADHHPHQLAGANRGAGDGVDPAPVLEDGDPPRQLEDLFQPVRDVEHGQTALLQEPHPLEEGVDLVRRKRGGRLIHDQDAGLERERLGDLDRLLLGDGELAHQGAGRDGALDAELGQQPGRRLLHRAVVDERSPRWLAAEKDVLGDRPLREEVELLVDDAHPPLLRLPRVAEADLLAVEEDRPRVGLIGADEDLHQGALAGAVLADDGMDLTGA